MGPRGILRVLFVEDNEDDARLLARHLERSGYDVDSFRVDTRDSFTTAVANARWDVVISDHSMPNFSSLEALSILKGRELDCPFIIVVPLTLLGVTFISIVIGPCLMLRRFNSKLPFSIVLVSLSSPCGICALS